MTAFYTHDDADFGKEVLQGAGMLAEMESYAETAKGVFEAIVPRDDNEWANSVRVEVGIEDSGGLRATGKLVSDDPHAKSKEFGHRTDVTPRLSSGKKSKRTRSVYVQGSRSMNKAMRAATSGGGSTGRGRR